MQVWRAVEVNHAVIVSVGYTSDSVTTIYSAHMSMCLFILVYSLGEN